LSIALSPGGRVYCTAVARQERRAAFTSSGYESKT
jgi:hypothetical protein